MEVLTVKVLKYIDEFPESTPALSGHRNPANSGHLKTGQ